MPQAENFPDAFVGRVTLFGYEPCPIMTGTQYSSLATNFAAVSHWVQPNPVYCKNLVLQNSLGAGVPTATGQASTGSEAVTYAISAYLYSRQDYSNNSSNLSPVVTASFGLSASLGYSSTSQQFGMSWLTNSTGGTSGTTLTSSDAAWSNFANGARVISMPFVTTLTAGEYWLALSHNSTTATSNSNVPLISMSNLMVVGQQIGPGAGFLGQTTTAGSAAGAAYNVGLIAATPTTNTTMALSTYMGGVARQVWFSLSNA